MSSILWLALFTAVSSSGPSSQATYQDQIENVRSLIRNQALEEALVLATSLVDAEPERPEAYFLAGDLYRHVWRPREAIELFERGLKEDLGTPADLHREIAVTLAELREWDEALSHVERALELSPDHAPSVFTKAMLLSQKGTRGEALRLYEGLLALDPDNASLHFRVGEIQESINRLDEAEASYRRAIQLAPDLHGARFRLGQLLLSSGRFQPAERELNKAVRLSVDHAPSHHELAKALDALERHAKAKHHFERALELDPNFGPAHLSYGNFANRTGDRETGRAQLETFQALEEIEARIAALSQAVERDPENFVAKQALIDHLLKLQRFPLALRMTQRFVLADRNDERYPLMMASIYEAWGREADAKRTLSDAAERFPDSEEVRERRKRGSS